MSSNKADLILHPVRLQIILALTEKELTTAQVAERLGGIPKSSIYRHTRALLEGGMVEVAETRPVKGVLEKVYRLAQSPSLSQADLKDSNRGDHLRYLAMFLASQLQGFSNYLDTRPGPDFLSDRVGYTEARFWVTTAELDQLLGLINQAILTNVNNLPAEGRHHHKITFITYPIFEGDSNHE